MVQRHVVRMRQYFVYILANRSRRLYIGVTNDMARRLAEHRTATTGFSARYRCCRLVLIETTADARSAIAREKQLKNWRREKKLALIQATNAAWDDLSGWDSRSQGSDSSTSRFALRSE